MGLSESVPLQPSDPEYDLFDIVCDAVAVDYNESRDSIRQQLASHPIWARLDEIPTRAVAHIVTRSCQGMPHDAVLTTLQEWLVAGVPSALEQLYRNADKMFVKTYGLAWHEAVLNDTATEVTVPIYDMDKDIHARLTLPVHTCQKSA